MQQRLLLLCEHAGRMDAWQRILTEMEFDAISVSFADIGKKKTPFCPVAVLDLPVRRLEQAVWKLRASGAARRPCPRIPGGAPSARTRRTAGRCPPASAWCALCPPAPCRAG